MKILRIYHMNKMWNKQEGRWVKSRRAFKQRGFLDLVLRWQPEKFDLKISKEGWVSIRELVLMMKKCALHLEPGEEVIRDAALLWPDDFEISEDKKCVRHKKFRSSYGKKHI